MIEIIKCKPGESGEDQTEARKRILKMHNKSCSYKGVEYKSFQALALKLNVSKATVSRAAKEGSCKGEVIKLTTP